MGTVIRTSADGTVDISLLHYSWNNKATDDGFLMSGAKVVRFEVDNSDSSPLRISFHSWPSF